MITSSFLKFQSLKQSRNKYKLDRLKEKVTKYDILPSYSESPGVFYNARMNLLTVPDSFMTGHYYDPSLPHAVNYAIAGSIIAHKMAHAIDLNGLSFDKRGNFLPLDKLDKELLEDINKSLNCFENQISSIFDDKIGVHLNGALTKIADFSDQLAIHVTVSLYNHLNDSMSLGYELRQYNSWQQFYISYGNIWCQLFSSLESLRVTMQSDNHSPRKYRSALPIVNTREFLQTFECPLEPLKTVCRVF